jgi:hypothetical protein
MQIYHRLDRSCQATFWEVEKIKIERSKAQNDPQGGVELRPLIIVYSRRKSICKGPQVFDESCDRYIKGQFRFERSLDGGMLYTSI